MIETFILFTLVLIAFFANLGAWMNTRTIIREIEQIKKRLPTGDE